MVKVVVGIAFILFLTATLKVSAGYDGVILAQVRVLVFKTSSQVDYTSLIYRLRKNWTELDKSTQMAIRTLIFYSLNEFLSRQGPSDIRVRTAAALLMDPIFSPDSLSPETREEASIIVNLLESHRTNETDFEVLLASYRARFVGTGRRTSGFARALRKYYPDILLAFDDRFGLSELGRLLERLRESDANFLEDPNIKMRYGSLLESALESSDPTRRIPALRAAKAIIERGIPEILTVPSLQNAVKKSLPYDAPSDKLSAEIQHLLVGIGYEAVDLSGLQDQIIKDRVKKQRELAARIRKTKEFTDEEAIAIVDLTSSSFDSLSLVEGAIELFEAVDEAGGFLGVFDDKLENLQAAAIELKNRDLEARVNALVVTAELEDCVRKIDPARMGLAN